MKYFIWLAALLSLSFAHSSLAGAGARHPVERAGDLAVEQGLPEALAFLERAAARGGRRYEPWLVRLTERLYERDRHALGEACFRVARQRLESGASPLDPGRGPSAAFLKGRLLEARGDLEEAFLAYQQSSPTDQHARKRLERTARRLEGRLRSSAAREK